MIVKQIKNESFSSYKEPAMEIGFPTCTFKCEKDCGEQVCQNGALATAPNIEISTRSIVDMYINNPITSAIIFAGLEPFDSWEDLKELVMRFREKTDDVIIIYTGYTYDELNYEEIHDSIFSKIKWLQRFPNIIIKFGRFVPNQEKHYDEILGVYLASLNQYGKRIS